MKEYLVPQTRVVQINVPSVICGSYTVSGNDPIEEEPLG